MKTSLLCLFLLASTAHINSQDVAKRIFDTEKSFEQAVAEKGINAGFIEFLSPVGIVFLPDAVNGREAWGARPRSPAALTWNPVWIDVSSNGVLAYTIGNSRYKPKGADDPVVFYGHYISIWIKQPDGNFRAALDTGINHPQPKEEPIVWKTPVDSGKETNPNRISAADSSIGFYQMAAASGPEKAYKAFLADDAIVMREGKYPAFGRKGALRLIAGDDRVEFARRKSFTEAVDLAYVHSPYTITDKKGTLVERGNFVQVWKFRNKRWVIVADIFVPTPKV